MTQLYAFTKKAFWQRPGAGPLIEPTFAQQKPGEKEVALDERWLTYLKRLNPDKTAYKHIISEDYGPSKGINDNRKLRWILAVYPGNVVMVDKLEGGYARLVGLPATAIPSATLNWIDNPHLIHKVYGSNSKGTAVSLPHAPFVPNLCNGRWIDASLLWRIDACEVDVKPKAICQAVFQYHTYQSPVNKYVYFRPTMKVIGVAIGEHGLWGEVEGGWIPLRYRGSQMTNWRI